MNMHKRIGWAAILLAFMLAACGGDGPGLAGGRNGPGTGGDPGGDPPGGENPGGENPDPTVNVSSIELLTSSTQMQSDGSVPVTLTAIAKDANNRVVKDVDIVFAASAGTLVVSNATTNEQGMASATLSTSEKTNRTIRVDASNGNLTDSVDVQVIGSSLNIQGPSSLVNGDSAVYTVTLTDAAGNPIPGAPVTFESSQNNRIEMLDAATDAAGQVKATVFADHSGSDTLRATALEDETSQPTVSDTMNVTVSPDSFRFEAPVNGTEVDLDGDATLTVLWQKDEAPVSGQSIRFASTRGSFNGTTDTAVEVTTGADGKASVDISSDRAGQAVITATNADGATIQRTIEFVATNPTAVSLQASPAIVATNESSTITATVRDASNNLVKNATVEFWLEDNTSGELSTPTAVTNSQGRAQTVFNASSTTTADNGVKVFGRVVQGVQPEGSTTLTVSGRALYVNFGTGNTIIEDDTETYYIKDYVVMVMDSSGSGVPNQTVNLSALPGTYRMGYLAVDPLTGEAIGYVTEAICANEDVNYNGILDPGEDMNHSRYPEDTFEDANDDGINNIDPGFGVLEPGSRALVSPGKVVTNDMGVATFQLIYPQDHAMWLDVILTAKTTVAGTETSRSQVVYLPISADDEDSPPNYKSPFGLDYFYQANCKDVDPTTAVYE